MFNTVVEWRNAGIMVAVIGLAFLASSSYSKISEATSDRRRQRALDELEGKSD